MILIIGGAYSGKCEYAKRCLGYDECDVSTDLYSGTPVLCGLHELLRDTAEIDDDALLELLLKKQVVICDEIGCGVVPVDESERMWRERVGRFCRLLSEQAHAVIRMSCGIPSAIKGKLPE